MVKFFYWTAGKSGAPVTLEGKEDIAEFAERAVCPHFGCACRALEDGSDLGEREFLKPAQQEDLAGIAVELGQGSVEQGVLVAGRCSVRGVGGAVGVIAQIVRIRGGGGGGRFPEVIRGAAPGQVIHPRGEAAVIAISVPVFQHALENGLRDVLGGAAITGELYEETEERRVMPFEEFAERVEFAVPDSEHQIMIGNGSGRGFHGSGVFNHDWRRMNTNI
jgi:hypothetical protein